MTRDGYKKHKDLIGKWAAGAEIEFRIDKSRPWIAADVPGWSVDCEYRIAQKPVERWALIDQNNVIWATFLTEKDALNSNTMRRGGCRIAHLKEIIE